jgi:hypothetical protein
VRFLVLAAGRDAGWRGSAWRGSMRVSTQRLDQGFVQAREGAEEFLPLPLKPGHHGLVLVGPALPFVEPAGLEDLDVVHARDGGGHLVAEVGA